MKRSILRKLSIFVITAILIFCFLPVVQGVKTDDKNINIRPIEDWLNFNPFGGPPGWADPNTMLMQRQLDTVWADGVSYEGYIVEKLMNDGSLHVTLDLKVEGMPIAIADWIIGEWVFIGTTDITFTTVIILDKVIPGGLLLDNVWDDEGNMVYVPDEFGELQPLIAPWDYFPEDLPDRELGAEWYEFLAPWWFIYWNQHEFGGHFEKMEFKSKGSGNYIAPGWYPAAPFDPVLLGEGNVKVHQISLYGYNLPLSNPKVFQGTVWTTPYGVLEEGGALQYSPLLMPEIWTVEYVKFF